MRPAVRTYGVFIASECTEKSNNNFRESPNEVFTVLTEQL